LRRCLVLTALLLVVLATAGSAAASMRLYAPLYYANPQAVTGFDRQSDGSLAPLPGSPFPLVTSPFAVSGIGGMAFAPDGRRAVTSFYFTGGVLGLSAKDDGSIVPAGPPIVTARAPGLAVSPDGRFAYAGTFDSGIEGILAYSLGTGGSLTALSGAPFGTGKYGDLAVSLDGRFLFGTTGSEVRRFAVNSDGTLSPLGATPLSGAAYVTISPDGRFLFVGAQGVPGTGVVSYSIEPDGSLVQNGAPALTGEIALEHFAVAPDGRHIYMPDDNLDGIVTASVGDDGTLAVIGTTPIENPGSVSASPDGRFLYAAHPGGTGVIHVLLIGADAKPVVLPFSTEWDSGEPERIVFQPQPGATPSLRLAPAAPGDAARFDASASTGATRYDWDFGDGTKLENGGPTPTHVYAKAGVYQVRLTATHEEGGCSVRQIYTGQSTTCPGGSSTTAPLDTLPAIDSLRVTNRRFAVAGRSAKRSKRGPAAAARAKRIKLGTAFRYLLTEAATVSFTIERKARGRVVGGACKPESRSNRTHRKCGLFRQAGPPLTVTGRSGANKTKFSGKLKGRRLSPGPYRATAVATDSAGGKSAPRRVSFKIVQR
jgi:6-phosphogluconolactonase (cycloisomerase 2 family)